MSASDKGAAKAAPKLEITDAVITLVHPIEGHHGVVRQIVLRPPVFREVMNFGEPSSRGYQRTGDVVYVADNWDVIRQYAQALLRRPAAGSNEPRLDSILLENLSLEDTLQIKEAVTGFFTVAGLILSGRTSTSLSST